MFTYMGHSRHAEQAWVGGLEMQAGLYTCFLKPLCFAMSPSLSPLCPRHTFCVLSSFLLSPIRPSIHLCIHPNRSNKAFQNPVSLFPMPTSFCPLFSTGSAPPLTNTHSFPVVLPSGLPSLLFYVVDVFQSF